MMAYLTYYGPGISPRMWSLWPQMHTCLMEWGIDYWENLLVCNCDCRPCVCAVSGLVLDDVSLYHAAEESSRDVVCAAGWSYRPLPCVLAPIQCSALAVVSTVHTEYSNP